MINRVKEFLNKYKITSLVVFVYIIVAIFISFSPNKLFLGIFTAISFFVAMFFGYRADKLLNEIASNNKEIIRLTKKGEGLYNEQIKLYEEQIKLLTEKNEILERRHAMLATGIPLEIAEHLNDKK